MRPAKKTSTPRVVLLGIAAVLFSGPSLVAQDAESSPLLTVRLMSGREFVAQVDARTNADLLWLRFSSGRGGILRPIAWDRITAARSGGDDIRLEKLQAFCNQIKLPASTIDRDSIAIGPLPEVIPAPPPRATASAIRIDAWLANWDSDVETDGLYLQLSPVDDAGQPVPVQGTVDVELFSARQRKYHEAPQSRGWTTELVERWTLPVEESQLTSQGILLRLPFGAVHPEFTTGVDDSGLVHVRLSVPGSGVFEQSRDGVRLRSWSPVRSGLMSQGGRRFFSSEAVGRNQ